MLGFVCLGACDADAPVGHIAGPPCADRMVYLPQLGACIDRYEAALDSDAEDAPAVSAEARLPLDGASWDVADRACREAGYRLCTAREWYLACSGSAVNGEGREFPYGDTFERDRCNGLADGVPSGEPAIAAGGAHERCVTELGVYDLSGNVFEWLSDVDASGQLRELRGGSYGTFERYSACVSRPLLHQPPDSGVPGRGFRCCADADL